MIGKSRLLFIAKYLFFGLLITCMTVVISLLYLSDKSNPDLTEEKDDLNYVGLPLPQFSEDMLDKNFEQCFVQYSLYTNGNHTSYSQDTSTPISPENISMNAFVSKDKIQRHPLIDNLLKFSELVLEFEMEIVLIEPSLLFCLLSPSLKSLLMKRNLLLQNNTSKNIVTMGVLQKYAVFLEKENIQDEMASKGFQVEIVKVPILDWMKSADYYNSSLFTSHIFVKKDKWILHLVVFHERSNYLWHASLLSQSYSKHPPKDSLHFVGADSAFENFTTVSLGFKMPCLRSLNIPSSPAHFLFQIETSRFLECNKTIVDNFRKYHSSKLPSKHSSLSVSRFNRRLAIALAELKSKLDPLLLRFWIWSGTMLGWHRQCDVIPYTSDADFGAWASDIDNFEQLKELFIKNENLKIKQKMGTVAQGLEFNLNCHDLRVDLFFLYQEENGTWYAGHSPKIGHFFKYHHPSFSLCSAELLGQKVLVPCETEKVIAAEYGSDWMRPVSSWSYETSAKNKGPNIYWDRRLLKEVYVDF